MSRWLSLHPLSCLGAHSCEMSIFSHFAVLHPPRGMTLNYLRTSDCPGLGDSYFHSNRALNPSGVRKSWVFQILYPLRNPSCRSFHWLLKEGESDDENRKCSHHVFLSAERSFAL